MIGNVLNIPQYTGGSGSSTLGGLSDVTITDVQDDQLLVYNSATGQWENAALAAYNINAVAITSGGASIQLSDGSATSDVDLLPGTNITFSVNEVTDEITINAANPPQQINIGNTNLTVEEPRTLDFYGSGTNNPLTFINTNGGTKTLFKFEQIGTGLTPQFTVGGGATDSEGQLVLAGNGSGRTGILIFNDDDGSNYTSFKAPNTLAQNINYVWPLAIGTANQVLEIGSVAGSTATLKWTTVSGGGGGIGATGATGATGFTGATGATGYDGATGATGLIGPRNGLPWQSTTVTTTPASGKFYYDASTTSLYINKTDSLGLDQTTFLNTFDDTGQPSTGFGAVILTAGNNQQILHGVITAVTLVGNVYDLTITELTNTSNWGSGIDFTLEFTAYGTSITGATGATGAAGGAGATGATGSQGATGAIGATGTQGAIGNQGAVGQQGATGEAGAIGATGTQGAIGKQGAIGLQGATGENGAIGATGTQGAIGKQGAIGLQGATGENGVVGFQGATGTQGKQGPDGFQGATGTIGGQGASGPAGAVGQQGATGEQGAIGEQGATGPDGKQGPDGNQGATGATGSQGALGGQGASGVSGSGDYGGFTTAYNSAAVSGAGFQTGKAVSGAADWKTSGATFYLSAQGTDPASGGTTIDYDVTKTVYANINNNAANGDRIYFRIWEYGSPEEVNFYQTAISELTISTGLNGGFELSKVQYIGGRDIATFSKPLFGWGVTGSAGAAGATGNQGAIGPQGPSGSGSGETLLWAGSRGYRAFIPNYSAGVYSFGQSAGASLPASPGYTTVNGVSAIVISNSGNLNTYNLTAGYRVNQNFAVGDKIIVRGSLWFNRTNSSTVTNLSQLNTALSYINSNGIWDPASSTQTLIPFAGTNNVDTHVVRTGTNGSTCIFEHETVCDAGLTVNIGDLLYFGWSIQNIGGEASYFSNACSISYQVYKA